MSGTPGRCCGRWSTSRARTGFGATRMWPPRWTRRRNGRANAGRPGTLSATSAGPKARHRHLLGVGRRIRRRAEGGSDMNSTMGGHDSDRRPNPYVGPRSIGAGEPRYGRDRELEEGRSTSLISQRIVLGSTRRRARADRPGLEAGMPRQLEARGFRVCCSMVRVGHGIGDRTNLVYAHVHYTFPLGGYSNRQAAQRRGAGRVGPRLLPEPLGRPPPAGGPRVSCVFFDQFEEAVH